MTTPLAPDHTTQLKMGAALQLLAQSGHSLPDLKAVGSTVWLRPASRASTVRVG